MTNEPEDDGQLYALGLIEKLRDDLRAFDGAKDELYYRIESALRELANPNLHDVNLVTAFKIELWDRYGEITCAWSSPQPQALPLRTRPLMPRSCSAVEERLTLRKVGMVLREHAKVEPSSPVTR